MRCLILLTTFNAEEFLEEQLASCAAQEVGSIDVLASDDGSSDLTRDILRKWQGDWSKGDFKIVSGPGKGFAENYRRLIVMSDADYDFYAFCDHDDIWHRDKLKRACGQLASHEAVPAAYCGRTRLIDRFGSFEGYSPVMAETPSFKNALFQSLAGGNTMVLNAAAMDLLRLVSKDVHFVAHDWWAYIWITGAGGRMIYDREPSIDYRQHAGNQIGKNSGLRARIRRMRMMLTKRYRSWIDLNLASVFKHKEMLTSENRDLMEKLLAARGRSGVHFAYTLAKKRIFRQSRLGTLSLYLGALSNRI